MNQPRQYLVRMTVFLAIVVAGAAAMYPTLQLWFLNNPILNGMILGVLVIGIAYAYRQVLTLWPEISWIAAYRRDQDKVSGHKAPRLLAPMATMLGGRKGALRLTGPAMRSLLDGIGSRLDEARDISRYMIGLLVFLGLLGTFWGLLRTVDAVADVIANLSVGAGDMGAVFGDLKSGLEAPLSGMGTAFSTSLFGLGGSLVLGFLDLQAGQAQNRFFNDLEDWLSGITRITAPAGAGDGEQPVPAYTQALLEQTAESLETLQRTLTEGEENRAATNANVVALAERLDAMTGQLSREIRLLAKTIAALAGKSQD